MKKTSSPSGNSNATKKFSSLNLNFVHKPNGRPGTLPPQSCLFPQRKPTLVVSLSSPALRVLLLCGYPASPAARCYKASEVYLSAGQNGRMLLGTVKKGVVKKAPPPAAPKPLNLPSQKKENAGYDPKIALVPSGSAGWNDAPPNGQPR